jgi:ankyrin repeat protein
MEFFMITLRQTILSTVICLCSITISALQTSQKPTQQLSYLTKFTFAAQQLLPVISRTSHSISTKIGTKNIIVAATLAGITGLLGINPIRRHICSESAHVLLKLSNFAPRPRLILLGLRLAMDSNKEYENYKPSIEHGDINFADDDQKTPLHFAALQGHTAIVKSLLAAGAHKDGQTNLAKHTPLHLAILSHRPEIVQTLVAAGANLEQSDNAQKTPLMLAVICGHDDIVEMLLKAGANKEAKDNKGYNALELAIDCLRPENKDKIRLLLTKN